ncbi:hypothetical protein KC359_g112 [Hortaea werneckii]|nr:hypothetical protein KC359_g112 [Hortaea werneckii]
MSALVGRIDDIAPFGRLGTSPDCFARSLWDFLIRWMRVDHDCRGLLLRSWVFGSRVVRNGLEVGREGQAPGSHGMHGAIDVYTTSRSSTLPKRSDDVPVLELTDDVSSMSCRPKVREGDGSRDVSGLGCIRFEVSHKIILFLMEIIGYQASCFFS